METKVFYSWQSDCPSNTNRNFILDALEKAITEIKNDDSISVDPVMDRDTLGCSGSPDITESIFSKIDEASVFVCDVSIINSDTNLKRPTPNPNVLIELGYAIHALGWNRIIMLMNKHFGEPDMLPFDLKTKRTTTYTISPDDSEKSKERNKLKSTLAEALKLIFEENPPFPNTKGEIEKIRSHDINIFKESDKILPEDCLLFFLDAILDNHSHRLDEKDYLFRYKIFFGSSSNKFVNGEIQKSVDKLVTAIGSLTAWTAANFFVYPDNQQNKNYRLCMQPHLHPDRRGDWSSNSIKQYDKFEIELVTLCESVKSCYKDYRTLIKNKLFI